MNWPAALKSARKRAGITVAQASRASGIAHSAISDLESGRQSGVTLATLLTLGETYGQTVSELIGETAPDRPVINYRERAVITACLEAIRSN